MESYKSCDKCFEHFNNELNKPYSIVPCGHEFCLNCIDNLDDNLCPTCSSEIEHKIVNWGLLKAIKNLSNEYDVFISYQWDIKEYVVQLYKTLTMDYNLKVWMDEFELGSSRLTSELARAISNSRVFLCCVTQKYSESRNCIHEINWAYNRRKKFIVLMFERLMMEDIPDVGFLIDPLVRHNIYKTPEIFEEWSGWAFEPIINAIRVIIEPNASSNRSLGMSRCSSMLEYDGAELDDTDLSNNIAKIQIRNDDEEEKSIKEDDEDLEEGIKEVEDLKDVDEDSNEDENGEDDGQDKDDEDDEEGEEDEEDEDNQDGDEEKKKKSKMYRLKKFLKL